MARLLLPVDRLSAQLPMAVLNAPIVVNVSAKLPMAVL